jgi:hypothetical protein
MFNRIFLLVCLAVLSSQATPILCTFDGTIINLNGTVVSVPISYGIIIDFDEPALYNGLSAVDHSQIWENGNYNSYNYGLAIMDPSSSLYLSTTENLIYSTSGVLHYEESFYGSIVFRNHILIAGNTPLIDNYSSLSLFNAYESLFSIGDVFSLTELSESDYAYGSVTLSAKTDYDPNPPPMNVPEPGILTLMVSSMLMLSGLASGVRNLL